jgi:hypothetical protein
MDKILSIEDAQEKIKNMSADWSKQWTKETAGSMTCGCVVGEKGSIITENNRGACHAWLNGGYRGKEVYNCSTGRYDYVRQEPLKYVISCYVGPCFAKKTYKGSPCPEEKQRQFIRWWVSDDNPLSKFILVRDEDFVYNYGLIIDAKKASWSEALLLCKVLRQAHENPSSRIFWTKLVGEGIDPMIALLTVERFITEVEGFYKKSFGGHCTSLAPHYNAGLQNLITRTIVTPEPKEDAGVGALVFLRSGGNDPFSNMEAGFSLPNGWGGVKTFTGSPYLQIVEAAKKLETDLRKGLKPKVTVAPSVMKDTAKPAPLKRKKM